MAYSNIEAIRQALLQESLSNLGGQDIKGLLSPTQTSLQAGLLGAMQGLAPYTGYTTTPTTFGQAIGSALTGAAGGVQKQKESNLTKALQGLELYGELAPNLTDFQKNVNRFNEIDAIPEEQRTTAEKNEYNFLKDRLTDAETKFTTGDVFAPILKKVAEGKSLTPGEEEVMKYYKSNQQDIFGFNNYSQSTKDNESKSTELSIEEIIAQMQDADSQEEAIKIFDNLSLEQQKIIADQLYPKET